ncbi:MAG: potassium channel family protein [Vibrio sp.]
MIRKKMSQTNNFYYMTYALVGFLVFSSLTISLPKDCGLLEYAVEALTLITFGVCLSSLRFGPRWKHFLLAITAAFVCVIAIGNIFAIKQMDVAILILMFLFFFGMFRAVSKQILFAGNIDMNKVVGSISLFLLLGLMWTVAYLIILEFIPEAFTGVEALPWGENFSHMAYFSFVTLTTLGYGDVSPITPFSEVIVYLEAIAGVFYMAIVVSSLVSSSISNQEK